MDILDGSVTYLIGSIEFSTDDGVSWRQQLIDMCWDNGLKIKFIDPCNKPLKIAGEIGMEKKKLQKLKEEGKWEAVKNIIHQIRRVDLRFVDYSDFLIAYIDPSIPTCGTIDEILLAEREKKPILCIVKGGAEKIPVWLLDVIPIEEIFDSVEDLVAYLVNVNNNSIELDDRWVLIRKQLNEFYDKQQRIQENRIRSTRRKILSEADIKNCKDNTLEQNQFEQDLITTVEYLREQVKRYQDIEKSKQEEIRLEQQRRRDHQLDNLPLEFGGQKYQT